MSGRKQIAKAKKAKAKLYKHERKVWTFNPVTRVLKNKKKDWKPSLTDY